MKSKGDIIFLVLSPQEKRELKARLKKFVVVEDECWVWTGHIVTKRGMPRPFVRFHTKRYAVHRLVAEAWLNFDPSSKLQVNHHCDNSLCVRPKHLYVGTQADNIRDMYARGRWKLKRDSWDVGTRKLEPYQVEEIKLKRAQGMKLREIEAEYGISKGQISRICNGRRWCQC